MKFIAGCIFLLSFCILISAANSRIKKYNVRGVARENFFSHASVVDDDLVFVAGTLGTIGESTRLAEGVYNQTWQALRNIQLILAGTNCTFNDIVKVNLHFGFEMNQRNLGEVSLGNFIL